jgi:hypothetical protein
MKQRDLLPRLRELTIFFWSRHSEEMVIVPILSLLSPTIRRLYITIDDGAMETMRDINQQAIETFFRTQD